MDEIITPMARLQERWKEERREKNERRRVGGFMSGIPIGLAAVGAFISYDQYMKRCPRG